MGINSRYKNALLIIHQVSHKIVHQIRSHAWNRSSNCLSNHSLNRLLDH